MRWHMLADTRRNTHWEDKPNEDFCWFDAEAGAALVLDGVTRDREAGRYPNPSPARLASEAFAAAARAALRSSAAMPPDERLARAAREGNQAVAAMNRAFAGDFLPGTVGILALLCDRRLHYICLGDANGILFSTGAALRFTHSQTDAVHRRRGEWSAHQIRTQICNHPDHPCGYGVWNGQDSARHFLCWGSLPLRPGDMLLLCTDGLDPFLRAAGEASLAGLSPEALLARAMAYTEGAWMDDRTAVVTRAEA